jgi:hypothetical protein
MKPIKYIGVALVAVAALGAVACNNESLSGPDFNSTNSSAVEKPKPQSSSSEIVSGLSSGEQKITQSSSSIAISSSGKIETCKHVTDVACEPCPPGEKCSCHPCDASKGWKSYDCRTGEELHCEDGEWLTSDQFCPDGRWTTYCNGKDYHNPVCCTEKETCVDVSGKVCAPCMEGYKCPCNPCEKENAEAIDCTTGKKLVCSDGEWSFDLEKSSSSVASSSSQSNFSIADKCLNISSMCPKCKGRDCPQSILPCNHCESTYDLPTRDCETGVIYVCQNDLWQPKLDEKCRDFVNMCPPCDPVVGCNLTNEPCNQCDSNVNNAARDCETGMTYICTNRLWRPLESPYETCKHITDFEGAGSRCPNQNGSTAVDCITKGNYQCKDDRWQNVACMNVKPDECKPGMGGCGYRLCDPNGIKEIADCENSVVYVCNGESWDVKKTEDNQRCARGELEYCGACFEEGKFEGRYKCEKGKWKKYGTGNEICEHITDVKCEFGNVGCGACDAPKNKEVRDCATGRDFVCQDNFWTAVVIDCDALTPECGFSEYDLCMKYNLTEYCNGKWLSEPCDGKESSRDLVVYENGEKLTNRGGNYICVNGKWIERFRYYECGEKEDCVPESVRCQASPAIGTACNNEGVPAEFDGCTLICSGGAYLYAPPPSW